MVADTVTLHAATARPDGRPRRPFSSSRTILPVRECVALHLSAAGYTVLAAEDAVVGGRMLLASRPDIDLSTSACHT